MRKDVECTFGYGLLEVDGLSEKWDQGIPTEWEWDLVHHDVHKCRRKGRRIHRINLCCKLSFNLFRKYLVTHFTKQWERKEIT
jgi:hypothetical protein